MDPCLIALVAFAGFVAGGLVTAGMMVSPCFVAPPPPPPFILMPPPPPPPPPPYCRCDKVKVSKKGREVTVKVLLESGS